MFKILSTLSILASASFASANPSAQSAVTFLSAGNTTYRIYFRKESLGHPGPPEILSCKEGRLKVDSTDQPAPFGYIAHAPAHFVALNFRLEADIVTKLRKEGKTADYELSAHYMPADAAVGSGLVNMRLENQLPDLNTRITAEGWVSEDQHSNSFVTNTPEMPNYVAVMALNPNQSCAELLAQNRQRQ